VLVAHGFLLGALTTLPAGAGEGKKAEDKEIKVSLDQVPAAVKATLEKEAQGAAIATVDKEGEKTVYEADVMINKQNWEIKVAPDGKLISKKVDTEETEESRGKDEAAEGAEVTLPLEQVPAAVRATLEKEAHGAAIATVDKEGEGTRTVYEADVMIDKQNWEIKVAPDGKLISKKLDAEEAEGQKATKAKAHEH
jgi:uncharacterized membrane protein YkoI